MLVAGLLAAGYLSLVLSRVGGLAPWLAGAVALVTPLVLAWRSRASQVDPQLGLEDDERAALKLGPSEPTDDGRLRAQGVHQGTPFALFGPGGKARRCVVRVPLRTDAAFSLRAAGPTRVVGWREDLPDLGRTFNQRYAVTTERPSRVSALLDHPDLVLLLRRLFNTTQVLALRAQGGWLDVYLRAPVDAEHPKRRAEYAARLSDALDGAVRLASLLSRRVIQVQGVRSLALTVDGAAGARTLCPYCKDDLDPEGPDPLEVCPRCRTAHHAECWTEAGGCTIYACAPPREADRTRAG